MELIVEDAEFVTMAGDAGPAGGEGRKNRVKNHVKK
jgi:hypothetical protein